MGERRNYFKKRWLVEANFNQILLSTETMDIGLSYTWNDTGFSKILKKASVLSSLGLNLDLGLWVWIQFFGCGLKSARELKKAGRVHLSTHNGT